MNLAFYIIIYGLRLKSIDIIAHFCYCQLHIYRFKFFQGKENLFLLVRALKTDTVIINDDIMQ